MPRPPRLRIVALATLSLLPLLPLLAAPGGRSAHAASPAPQYTTIVVTDMHCSACAKKIAAKLYALPGVLEVRADVKKDTAYVVPQRHKTVSPRAMWEAVQSAGFSPARLSGPGGTFTSKPPA